MIPLAEVEKRAILHAMDVTKGDRTLAAAMLEIGRTTLYRKLKDYGLQELECASTRCNPLGDPLAEVSGKQLFSQEA